MLTLTALTPLHDLYPARLERIEENPKVSLAKSVTWEIHCGRSHGSAPFSYYQGYTGTGTVPLDTPPDIVLQSSPNQQIMFYNHRSSCFFEVIDWFFLLKNPMMWK